MVWRWNIGATQRLLGFGILAVALVTALPVEAQKVTDTPAELEGVAIEEKVGAKLPTEMNFIDHRGHKVKLGDVLDPERPTLFTFVYYECPMLCTLVLNGLVDGLKQLNWRAGDQYAMVSITIDPDETTEMAAAKRQAYLEAMGDHANENAWTFLTGDEATIKALAAHVGFGYRYDQRSDEYAHPAAALVITPEGKVSRYLYGTLFQQRDLRLALVEASENKIGSAFDRVLLYCFRYDPQARGYVLYARNFMKLGGAVTIVGLGLVLGLFWRRERHEDETSFESQKEKQV